MNRDTRLLQPPAICWKIGGRFHFLQAVWADSGPGDFGSVWSEWMGDEAFLVRTGILQGFDEACRAHGVDAGELVDEVGLPREVLTNPELYMPREKSAGLFLLAAERTGCPSFGLELATSRDHRVLGALSHLIFRGATVGESLDLARQYLSFHIRGADFSHRPLDNHWSAVELNLGFDATPETRPSADFTIVHVAKILRELCGEHYEPREIWMTHPEPSDSEPYSEFFVAPIIWGQPVLAVVLPTSVLDRPPASVPNITDFLQQHMETVAAPLEPENLGEQTRAVLRSLIGRSSATAEIVAAALSMHVREFQRELKSLGLSFRDLRDDVHREYACAALRKPDATVSELALTLGYSDGSAFSRAFKKWTGQSPSVWRRNALDGNR